MTVVVGHKVLDGTGGGHTEMVTSNEMKGKIMLGGVGGRHGGGGGGGGAIDYGDGDAVGSR